MESLMSATAVKWLTDGRLLLATSEAGIFIKEKGTWNPCLHTGAKKVRDFHESAGYIYGVGDSGLFIRSKSGGKGWTIKRFPTKATVWNVCSSEQGVVAAHGEKLLFLSFNYGETFSVLDPFRYISIDKPSIRSLFLYENFLFIGTKVHRTYGGIWRLNLNTLRCTQVKKETERMTSSITIINNFLVATFGSTKGKNGTIEFSPMDEVSLLHEDANWHTCDSENKESCYLHICGEEENVYATTNHNETGYSTVSKVFLTDRKIIPYGKIKGHGWRVASEKEDFAVAGLYESICYQKYNEKRLLH